MAEAGDPQGDVFPSDPITSESVIPLLKGSEELEKSLPQPKDLQKHSSEVPCLEKNQEDASHIKAKPCVPGMQCVVDSKQGRPHSIAEVHISDGVVGVQKGDGVNHRNEHPLFFMQKSFSLQKDLRGDKLESSKLPAEKSCSEILESEKESPAISPLCESSGPVCAGKDQKRPARSLVCKQAMQLQQSNAVTTFCRASSSSLSSPTQQGCARVCNSSPVQALKESGGETKHSRFAETVCCGAHFHGPFEDTFAAYCHPQPIPAPAQLLPRLTGMEDECNSRGQIGGPVLLSLPPLISSVSETGLDAKRVLRCCHLDCNWPGPLHHPGCQQLAMEVRKCTREAGTMTSCQQLRDMGVQVGQTELEKPPQHVFPEVCLVEDKTNGSDKPVPSQKTPVKEVKWDAEGMTWEVYGASVDPEELGLAIQKHLELQIKEAAGRGSKISRENTSMSQTSIRKEQPKRKRGVIAALRRPGCCARTTTAVD